MSTVGIAWSWSSILSLSSSSLASNGMSSIRSRNGGTRVENTFNLMVQISPETAFLHLFWEIPVCGCNQPSMDHNGLPTADSGESLGVQE